MTTDRPQDDDDFAAHAAGQGPSSADEHADLEDTTSGPGSSEESAAAGASAPAESVEGAEPLSPEDQLLLDEALNNLVAEYRDRAARAEAELVNFRTRVERDRQANRESVIAEVLRAVIPALDDLTRAEAHGDIAEGSSLAIVATKLRGAFEKFGLTQVGEKGEPFDPTNHEPIASIPGDVETETVLDVLEPGYLIGDRVIRPAKVAVAVPRSGD